MNNIHRYQNISESIKLVDCVTDRMEQIVKCNTHIMFVRYEKNIKFVAQFISTYNAVYFVITLKQ